MEIIFKDGNKIEFKKYGNIWLANNVIWEGTELYGSLDELRELKAKINQWFEENAPEEIRERYNVRPPLWVEISTLPFKDQVAFREGKIDQIAEYFLGDEDDTRPVSCDVGVSYRNFGWFYCVAHLDWSVPRAIRLCLEEKHAN